MMQSSVPWRRSRNGDTTTICKQVSVCASFSRGCLRDRKISWKLRNSEQHAKHEPKIGVQDEVLVSNETEKAQWEDQQKGVPENRKPDWNGVVSNRVCDFLVRLSAGLPIELFRFHCFFGFEVLVSNETEKAQWEDQQKGVPENRKPDWKPHRSFQILCCLPRGMG